MKLFGHDEVSGIDAIAKELGILNLAVVLDWRIAYALPIVKSGGIWLASRSALRKWRREHPDLTDRSPEIKRVTLKTPRPKRWGL